MIVEQDPTIKIKKGVKKRLISLDIASYGVSASQIIEELINHYEKTKNRRKKNVNK